MLSRFYRRFCEFWSGLVNWPFLIQATHPPFWLASALRPATNLTPDTISASSENHLGHYHRFVRRLQAGFPKNALEDRGENDSRCFYAGTSLFRCTASASAFRMAEKDPAGYFPLLLIVPMSGVTHCIRTKILAVLRNLKIYPMAWFVAMIIPW